MDTKVKRKSPEFAEQIESVSPDEKWKMCVWKGLEFPNYECSNFGRYRNIVTGRILKQVIKLNDGRLKGCMTLNRKQYYPNMHTVIAATWIPNPENKREVNHIDGNPINNKAENLEWNSSRENHLHASENGLMNKKPQKRKVKLIEKDLIFDGALQCAKWFIENIDKNRTPAGVQASIRRCCNKQQKTYLEIWTFEWVE